RMGISFRKELLVDLARLYEERTGESIQPRTLEGYFNDHLKDIYPAFCLEIESAIREAHTELDAEAAVDQAARAQIAAAIAGLARRSDATLEDLSRLIAQMKELREK